MPVSSLSQTLELHHKLQLHYTARQADAHIARPLLADPLLWMLAPLELALVSEAVVAAAVRLRPDLTCLDTMNLCTTQVEEVVMCTQKSIESWLNPAATGS